MSLEPLIVGSIKDRVVCSVWALGELATRERLGKAIDCNSSLLSVAIESLERDGYIHLADAPIAGGFAGHYVLAEEIAATMPPKRTPPDSTRPTDALDDAPVASAPAAPPTLEAIDMAKKRRCTSCGQEKDAEKDFYANQGKCKPCQLKRQRELKAAKNGISPAPTTRTSKPNSAEPAIADELVIPAAGEIHCRVLDAGAGPAFVFQQGDDQVVCSLEQLQVMRDWADARIKKATAQ